MDNRLIPFSTIHYRTFEWHTIKNARVIFRCNYNRLLTLIRSSRLYTGNPEALLLEYLCRSRASTIYPAIIYDEDSDISWDKDSISILTAADIPSDILPKSQNTATKVIGFNCA